MYNFKFRKSDLFSIRKIYGVNSPKERGGCGISFLGKHKKPRKKTIQA